MLVPAYKILNNPGYLGRFAGRPGGGLPRPAAAGERPPYLLKPFYLAIHEVTETRSAGERGERSHSLALRATVGQRQTCLVERVRQNPSRYGRGFRLARCLFPANNFGTAPETPSPGEAPSFFVGRD